MIGEERRVCRSPSSPASTGHVLTFLHRAAASFSSSSGSSSETNSPSSTLRIVWVETKVCLSALSRPRPSQAAVLAIRTVRRNSSAPRRSAWTSTSPSSARQLRTSAPTTAPSGARSGSSALPAGTRISARLGGASSASGRSAITTCRSVASSQQLVDERERSVLRPAADTPLHHLEESHPRPHRRRRPDHQALRLHPPGVGVPTGLAEGARVDPAERPALLILGRRAPVGPEYVTLVQDGRSDLLNGVRHCAPPRSAASSSRSSAASQVGSPSRMR